MRSLVSLAQKFARDVRGNTTMILGLCILPIGMFAGAAIDFSRAESNGNDLRANLDSASIAAAKFAMDNPDADEEAVKAFATNYIKMSFEPHEGKTLDNLVIEFVPDERVTMSAESTIQSTILGIAKVNDLTSKTRSTASMGVPTGLRAVLVLDSSSSMKGAKIDALEDAAEDFVTQLVEEGGNSYVGVVPFSHYVNVGMHLKDELWLDIPIAESESHNSCITDKPATEALGCVHESYDCTKNEDGMSYTGTCWRWNCPSGVEVVKNCTSKILTDHWCGAVVQRKPPHHLLDSNYTAQPIEAYMSSDNNTWECNTPIQPMTNSLSTLETYLGGLSAKGDTYIAPGLMWGYRLLTPEAPFTEMSSHTVTKSAIVLMSDGMNSRSFQHWGTGSDHYGSDTDDSNNVTLDTCDFIKSNDVEIYAIAFQVNDTTTENMLKNCATSFSHYFDADSFAELAAAFNSVAGSFREIALTE